MMGWRSRMNSSPSFRREAQLLARVSTVEKSKQRLDFSRWAERPVMGWQGDQSLHHCTIASLSSR
jgi:hypothetical protein